MEKYKIKQIKPFELSNGSTWGRIKEEWLPEKDCWITGNYKSAIEENTGDFIHPARNKYSANIPEYYFEVVGILKDIQQEIQELLRDYIPKGQLKYFPKEIIAKMLERQYEQSNVVDVKAFEEYAAASTTSLKPGFDWDETPEGNNFWNDILSNDKLDVFFKKYPKQEVRKEIDSWCVQVNERNREVVKWWVKERLGVEGYSFLLGNIYGYDKKGNFIGYALDSNKQYFNKEITTQEFYDKIGVKLANGKPLRDFKPGTWWLNPKFSIANGFHIDSEYFIETAKINRHSGGFYTDITFAKITNPKSRHSVVQKYTQANVLFESEMSQISPVDKYVVGIDPVREIVNKFIQDKPVLTENAFPKKALQKRLKELNKQPNKLVIPVKSKSKIKPTLVLRNKKSNLIIKK